MSFTIIIRKTFQKSKEQADETHTLRYCHRLFFREKSEYVIITPLLIRVSHTLWHYYITENF